MRLVPIAICPDPRWRLRRRWYSTMPSAINERWETDTDGLSNLVLDVTSGQMHRAFTKRGALRKAKRAAA